MQVLTIASLLINFTIKMIENAKISVMTALFSFYVRYRYNEIADDELPSLMGFSV